MVSRLILSFKEPAPLHFSVKLPLPWEQTPEFIRSGHRDPSEFEPHSLRTITLSEEEGIKAVVGKLKGKTTTEVVSYLFERKRGWTLEKAKAWFREHEARAKESFGWSGSIEAFPSVAGLIRGKALHPIKTVHPAEWPNIRVYLEEELAKSAPTLRGKPLLLDHFKPLHGEVLNAEYEDGAVEYIAMLKDPEVLRMIENGDIQHCSVELDWRTLENVNGVAPRGIMFTGLSLLKDFEPGDPLSSVEIWESIIKRLKEARIKPAPPNQLQERVWTRQYISQLPDSAFALVYKENDRVVRKFPHHRADGSLDPVHLRNANARLPQSELTEEQKREAGAHLDRHKKALGIGEFAEGRREPFKHGWVEQEEIEFEVAPEPSMDELIETIEVVVEEVNAAFDDLTARVEALEKSNAVVEPEMGVKAGKKPLSEAIVPPTGITKPCLSDWVSREEVLRQLKGITPERVPAHWGYGPFELVRKQKELIKKLESRSL